MQESSLYTETLQKIGRNVVDFQRLEGMLKVLLGSIEFDSALGDPETQIASWHELVSKKTMGTVSKDLLEKIFSEPIEPVPMPIGVKQRQSFQLRLGGSSEYIDQIRESFERIVTERNELIPHRLLDFEPSSDGSCKKLVSHLDSQHSRIQSLLDFLRNQMQAVCNGKKMTAELLKQLLEEDIDRGQC